MHRMHDPKQQTSHTSPDDFTLPINALDLRGDVVLVAAEEYQGV